MNTTFRRAAAAAAAALSFQASAVHFDVELRTVPGPVAGARITTDFFGDLGLAGALPIDGETGQRIYPGYFGDLEGGPFLTDDPGFQAFPGTFLRDEIVSFRALGTLRYWNPQTLRWSAAPQGVEVILYGNIPIEVEIGFDSDPAAWREQYEFHRGGTRFGANGIGGPLTAIIDAARRRGEFHAHLDWKITAPPGAAPPVGAYMVTLQLWSPTLQDGAPKYLPSEPIQVLFERGISEAQLAQALRSRIEARPAAPSRQGAPVPRAHWSAPPVLPWGGNASSSPSAR
ncbi:MAG: hypothetical protein J0M00_19640 [Burkholderiales bacterium]|nr:hypothetical protein [Burkholderiales bacterium]